MSHSSVDRDLLFGILALQNNFILRDALLTAFSIWVQDKKRPLGEILCELGKINKAQLDLLYALAEQHVHLHDDDPEKSLAALSSVGSVRAELQKLNDPDLAASLAATLEVQSGSAPLEPTLLTFPPGDAGRFRVLRPHARGGLGEVFIADDRELHREVALKEIQAKYADLPESRARFLLEAEITGGLEHPGIVPVYGLGQYGDGRPYYAMRFIRGDSLAEAITQFHKSDRSERNAGQVSLELRKLLGRFVDVCEAIHYAHSRGILHRDLKPGNIMLGKYGETLVVDWGLAKAIGRDDIRSDLGESTLRPQSGESIQPTVMGTAIGTPAYMSPEQAAGRHKELGIASDIYSLGATLYCLLTGKAPYTSSAPEPIAIKVQRGDFPKPREIKGDIPIALEAVCLKAMAIEPSRRYESAVALSDEIERWLADEPVTAFNEPWTARGLRFIRHHQAMFASLLALASSIAIASIAIAIMVKSQNAQLAKARDAAEANRYEATLQKELADASRVESDHQRTRAEENLLAARTLALSLLTTAEDQLSKPAIDGKILLGLRKSMTEQSFRVFQDIFDSNPQSQETAYEFAQIARVSGNLKRLERDFESASERTQLSLSLQLSIPEDKRTLTQKEYLAETLRELGTLRKAEGKLHAAELALLEASSMIEKLLTQDPLNASLQRIRGTIEIELIGFFVDKREFQAALSKAESAVSAFSKMVEMPDTLPMDAIMFLLGLSRQIQMLYELDRQDEAGSVSEVAIATAEAIRKNRSDDANIQLVTARIYYWSAEGMLENRGSFETINKRLEQAIAIARELSKRPLAPYMYLMGDILRVQGNSLRLQSKAEEAKESFAQSRAWFEKLIQASDTGDNRDGYAKLLLDMSTLSESMQDRVTAKAFVHEAITMQSLACERSPESRLLKQLLEDLNERLKALR